MQTTIGDPDVFHAGDVSFHGTVMAISGNRLAESIARVLFERARSSARFQGSPSPRMVRHTLQEHEVIFAAIEAGDSGPAEQVMQAHISDAWLRRRPPDHRGTKSLRQPSGSLTAGDIALTTVQRTLTVIS